MKLNITSKGAVLDETRKYRYTLWRVFGTTGYVVYVCLNPSTADENIDDATVRKCMGYAHRWGFGGIIIVNLFALRSKSPNHMKKAVGPIGPLNNVAILDSARRASRIVCAWGNHGSHIGRDKEVVKMLSDFKLYCLGQNGDGSPKHPLYLKSDLQPQEFRP